MPFSNLHKYRVKDDLSKKYQVKGIPALVVLDGSSGDVITLNGRNEYGNYFRGEYSTASGSMCAVS